MNKLSYLSLTNADIYTIFEIWGLEIIEIYEWYDKPCLFACQNELGLIFIVIWIDQTIYHNVWLYTRINLERFNALRKGEIDLYTLYKDSEYQCIKFNVPLRYSSSIVIIKLSNKVSIGKINDINNVNNVNNNTISKKSKRKKLRLYKLKIVFINGNNLSDRILPMKGEKLNVNGIAIKKDNKVQITLQ